MKRSAKRAKNTQHSLKYLWMWCCVWARCELHVNSVALFDLNRLWQAVGPPPTIPNSFVRPFSTPVLYWIRIRRQISVGRSREALDSNVTTTALNIPQQSRRTRRSNNQHENDSLQWQPIMSWRRNKFPSRTDFIFIKEHIETHYTCQW